jgi:hypothetical protein
MTIVSPLAERRTKWWKRFLASVVVMIFTAAA